MTKKIIDTKPKYGRYYPSINCDYCDGRGEQKDQLVGFLSYHWTYKKCTECNGSGKNIWSCMWCKFGVISGDDFWCPNLKCEKYAVKVALANKAE